MVDRRGNVLGVIGGLGWLFGERVGFADGDAGAKPPPAKRATPAVDQ